MEQNEFISTAVECPVNDAFLEMLRGIFMNNFKNVTEMEAVMRVGMVVACAVKDLDVWVHLQPSIQRHPTFTDFMFVIKGAETIKSFIKVKKASENTSLRDSTAQVLREAHILLTSYPAIEKIPFVLINTYWWSFAIASRCPSTKITILSTFDVAAPLDTLTNWKTILHHIRALIKDEDDDLQVFFFVICLFFLHVPHAPNLVWWYL